MVERLSPIVPSRGEAEETASGSFKQKPKDDAIPQNLQAKESRSMTAKLEDIGTATPNLLGDIRKVIEAAREQTAQAVNSTLVIMYWQIGKRIREDVLGNQRAEYGKEILQVLSGKLTAEYGKGFTEKALWRMMQFAEVFPYADIVATLSRQLSWSHLFWNLVPTLRLLLGRNASWLTTRITTWISFSTIGVYVVWLRSS
jgi:hypothetical protein